MMPPGWKMLEAAGSCWKGGGFFSWLAGTSCRGLRFSSSNLVSASVCSGGFIMNGGIPKMKQYETSETLYEIDTPKPLSHRHNDRPMKPKHRCKGAESATVWLQRVLPLQVSEYIQSIGVVYYWLLRVCPLETSFHGFQRFTWTPGKSSLKIESRKK